MESYNVFINKVIISVKEKLGKDYEVKAERILKNNSCEYQSLLICNVKEKDDECRISPAIRMDNMYELYKKGISIDYIIDEVLKAYDNGMKDAKSIKGVCKIGDNIVSHIFFRLINTGQNTEILDASPHIDFQDLSLTFHYMCSNDGSMLQSFRVTHKIAEEWNVSTEELMGYAMKNAPILFPEKFMTMESVIKSLCIGNNEVLKTACPSDEDIPMYVLTNETGFNGASVILYSTKLSVLAEHYNSNLYILPSSIHEVILVPQNEYDDCVDLKKLVKEVNENHVDKAERLSDNVYLYDKKDKTIRIC